MNRFLSSNRPIMQGQQINLKWNSFHSNILSSFESMWEEEGLVDVTLATEGKCLKAHKIMLSASSPFFKKIFKMNPCQHPVIVLQDVNFTELEAILKFVYKGEVCISQDHLPLLLRAAETLQIRGLCRRLSSESDAEEEVEPSGMQGEVQSLEMENSCHSSKNAKRAKSSHSYNMNMNNMPSPVPPLSAHLNVPVYPVAVDEIKHESDLSSLVRDTDEPDPPTESATPLSDTRMLDSGNEENDFPSSVNEYAMDLGQNSENFSFPPFPCPFCDRAYTRWGFRRRHIKACHTKSQSLPCKWCLEVLPTHTDWESHVCSKHSLSRSDAKNGLMILEEAEVVLQIPQPSRLDALVTMIREQNTKIQDVEKDDGKNLNDTKSDVDENDEEIDCDEKMMFSKTCEVQNGDGESLIGRMGNKRL